MKVSKTPPDGLVVEVGDNGTCRITLNSPPANLLTSQMLRQLQSAITQARDDRIRVVVLAANGAIFSAGHDLREVREMRGDPDGGRERISRLLSGCAEIMASLASLDKPVVAEVGGLATASGCQLVASCDIVIASETARFGVNGVDVGFFCSTPMVPLVRAVGSKMAADLLMSGEMIGATEAADAGLVSRVVPAESLADETARLVQLLCTKPARVLALGKAALRSEAGFARAQDYADMIEVAVKNLMMPEADEGITAFLEKREPAWRSDHLIERPQRFASESR